MEALSTSPNIVWDTPEPGSSPPPAPASVPAPANAAQAQAGNIIWDHETSKTAQPSGWNTLKAVVLGLMNPSVMASDPEMRNSFIRTSKSLARGALGAMASATGDTDEMIASRNKNIGLDEPSPSTSDKVSEFLGGVLAPFPGGPAGKAASSLKMARTADKVAGTTAGQQTGNTAIQMLEKTLSRLPGGGALVESIRNQTDKVAHTTDDIVRNLSGGADTSATGSGRVINKQMEVASQRMKELAGSHFDEVDKLIPPETPIGVKGTLETLKRLTSIIPGAESSSKNLINSDISALGRNIQKDVGKTPQIDPGFLPKAMLEGINKDLANSHLQALPYSAVKQLRTKIGQSIEWGPFSTDPKNGQLKQLYAALTADMNNGASSVSDKAAAAVSHANSAYAASKATQKILNSVIDKAGGPEKVFTSLMNSTKDGASTITEVVSHLDEPSRNILAASALQRMGRAAPGAQDVAGEIFSADSFLKNWHTMSPEAREVLFGRLPGDYSQNVTDLVANVGKLKAYSKILPNYSSTAQAMLWGGEVGGALMALMTGHPGTAAGIAGSAVGTMTLSAALTNPRTIKWLASETGKLAIAAAKGGVGVHTSKPMGAPNGTAETLLGPGQANGASPSASPGGVRP